jgi:MarR family transcriptional regulator, temperature-dependent positive regulator of motility
MDNDRRKVPQDWAVMPTSSRAEARRSTAFNYFMATSTDTTAPAISIDLYDQPGHLIRRAHQISVSMFHDLMGRQITPVQYSILRMLQELPGLDQVTLAQRVGLDTSTTADIAVRLEAKGWIVREVLPRRQRRLLLTQEGEKLLDELIPAVDALNHGLLDGMGEEDAQALLRLLRKFVHLNNDQSRAPLRSSDSGSGSAINADSAGDETAE